jgi:hypothetical protein
MAITLYLRTPAGGAFVQNQTLSLTAGAASTIDAWTVDFAGTGEQQFGFANFPRGANELITWTYNPTSPITFTNGSTVTFNLYGYESAMTCNYGLRAKLLLDGGIVMTADDGIEMNTVAGLLTFTANFSAQFTANSSIALQVFVTNIGTAAVGTGYLLYDGAVASGRESHIILPGFLPSAGTGSNTLSTFTQSGTGTLTGSGYPTLNGTGANTLNTLQILDGYGGLDWKLGQGANTLDTFTSNSAGTAQYILEKAWGHQGTTTSFVMNLLTSSYYTTTAIADYLSNKTRSGTFSSATKSYTGYYAQSGSPFFDRSTRYNAMVWSTETATGSAATMSGEYNSRAAVYNLASFALIVEGWFRPTNGTSGGGTQTAATTASKFTLSSETVTSTSYSAYTGSEGAPYSFGSGGGFFFGGSSSATTFTPFISTVRKYDWSSDTLTFPTVLTTVGLVQSVFGWGEVAYLRRVATTTSSTPGITYDHVYNTSTYVTSTVTGSLNGTDYTGLRGLALCSPSKCFGAFEVYYPATQTLGYFVAAGALSGVATWAQSHSVNSLTRTVSTVANTVERFTSYGEGVRINNTFTGVGGDSPSVSSYGEGWKEKNTPNILDSFTQQGRAFFDMPAPPGDHPYQMFAMHRNGTANVTYFAHVTTGGVYTESLSATNVSYDMSQASTVRPSDYSVAYTMGGTISSLGATSIGKVTGVTYGQSTLSSTLATGHRYGAGANAPTAGYSLGGTDNTTASTEVQKLTFSTETASNPAGTISTAANAPKCFSSASKAYTVHDPGTNQGYLARFLYSTEVADTNLNFLIDNQIGTMYFAVSNGTNKAYLHGNRDNQINTAYWTVNLTTDTIATYILYSGNLTTGSAQDGTADWGYTFGDQRRGLVSFATDTAYIGIIYAGISFVSFYSGCLIQGKNRSGTTTNSLAAFTSAGRGCLGDSTRDGAGANTLASTTQGSSGVTRNNASGAPTITLADFTSSASGAAGSISGIGTNLFSISGGGWFGVVPEDAGFAYPTFPYDYGRVYKAGLATGYIALHQLGFLPRYGYSSNANMGGHVFGGLITYQSSNTSTTACTSLYKWLIGSELLVCVSGTAPAIGRITTGFTRDTETTILKSDGVSSHAEYVLTHATDVIVQSAWTYDVVPSNFEFMGSASSNVAGYSAATWSGTTYRKYTFSTRAMTNSASVFSANRRKEFFGTPRFPTAALISEIYRYTDGPTEIRKSITYATDTVTALASSPTNFLARNSSNLGSDQYYQTYAQSRDGIWMHNSYGAYSSQTFVAAANLQTMTSSVISLSQSDLAKYSGQSNYHFSAYTTDIKGRGGNLVEDITGGFKVKQVLLLDDFSSSATAALSTYDGTGYMMGGYNTAPDNGIVRIDIHTGNRYLNAAWVLPINRQWGAGFASKTKGYASVGFSSTGGRNATIDSVTFSNDAVVNDTAVFTTAREYPGSYESFTKGYIVAGFTTVALDSMEALTFATETTAVLSAVNTVARYSVCGVNSDTHGYAAGGVENSLNTNRVDRLNFATEACTLTSVSIVQRQAAGGICNATHAFFGGGATGSYLTEIDGMQFDLELYINPAAVLSFSGYGVNAVSGSTYGIWGPRWDGSTRATFDRFTFATQTISAIGGVNELGYTPQSASSCASRRNRSLGTATATVAITSTGSGVVLNDGAISGTGANTLAAFIGSGSGAVTSIIVGTGANTVVFTGSGSGLVLTPITGYGTSTISVTGAGTGATPFVGTGANLAGTTSSCTGAALVSGASDRLVGMSGFSCFGVVAVSGTGSTVVAPAVFGSATLLVSAYGANLVGDEAQDGYGYVTDYTPASPEAKLAGFSALSEEQETVASHVPEEIVIAAYASM